MPHQALPLPNSRMENQCLQTHRLTALVTVCDARPRKGPRPLLRARSAGDGPLCARAASRAARRRTHLAEGPMTLLRRCNGAFSDDRPIGYARVVLPRFGLTMEHCPTSGAARRRVFGCANSNLLFDECRFRKVSARLTVLRTGAVCDAPSLASGSLRRHWAAATSLMRRSLIGRLRLHRWLS